MKRAEAKNRIEKLKKVIEHHRYLYHVLDRQEISDEALDSLKHELKTLEDKFPDLRTLDSPTQRVGGKPLDKFEKVRHISPMLSLEDAFNREDLEDWVKKLERFSEEFKNAKKEFFCDLKMDGLAVELVYEKGFLIQASTRGDGLIGEDITQNVKTIEAIPLKLKDDKPDKTAVVRGEIYLRKKEFERINREQKKKGLKEYANPRNIAAGSIRQLDPKVTAERKLNFYAYGIVHLPNDKNYYKNYSGRDSEYKKLEEWGIPANPHRKTFKSIGEVVAFRDRWERARNKLGYDIDGIVVTINDNELYEKLGSVGKTKRGTIAFKFSPKEATTKIKDIVVQVGRTGALTPVAVLEPVQIGGTIVSRATLHNEDEIKRLGVKIGDTVVVGRAGDVIPDVREVIKDLRKGNEKSFHMPGSCPVCKNKIVKDGAIHRCKNKKCPARHRESLYHFVGKHAFDIEGLGHKIIDVLLDQGLIQDAADLFDLKEGDVAPLERFGKKSAQNLIEAINGKRKISLPRFIMALGILYVGEETAQDLAKYFGSLAKLKKAKLEELEKIPNIGGVVAKSIYNWFRDDYHQKFLQKLLKHVKIERVLEGRRQTFKGKTFVLTGALQGLSRDQAKAKIRDFGGNVSSSVSKNTDFVVAGKGPGSKLNRAKKLGVKIINEKEFLRKV